jgi:NAD(P)-dependent dehydrogenase (short-subunit alcohol dehydrogenase family)
MKVLIIGADSALSQAIMVDLDRKNVAYVATSRRKDSNHYYLDVDNLHEVAAGIKEILHLQPDISHLVYTPAISADGITHRISPEKWTQVFTTNLFGAVAVINSILPYFMKKKAGHIQLIASSSSDKPELYSSAYSASKSALVSFAKSIAQEYARFGIICYAFSPGFFSAGMLENEKRMQHIEGRIPNGKIASKEEVSQFSVQLLDTSHYINGSNIIFNGGM